MLTELREKLRKYNRVEIAVATNVSISTIDKIISGANDNPTVKTLELLQRFIDQKEGAK